MKHTKGPWIVDGEIVRTAGSDSYRTICDLGPKQGQLPATLEANARLIAAAPEMLEALEDVAGALQSTDIQRLKNGGDIIVYHFEQETIDTVLSLIAKARGDS